MMNAALTLVLNPSQAAQLVNYCRIYRAYAWRTLSPSPERNQIMKAAQAVQGRLAEGLPGAGESLHVLVSAEEKQALRQMILTLMQMYGAEPPSAARHQMCRELGTMRLVIERIFRQTQAL